MRKKKPNFPLGVKKPIRLGNRLEYHTALLNVGLTSREKLALLMGDTDAISKEKIDAANVDIFTSRVNTGLNEFSAKFKKLLMLRDHYGIDETSPAAVWAIELCMRLCEDLIPNFGVEGNNNIGRPRTRTPVAQLELVLAIEKIKADRCCTDSEAIKQHLVDEGTSRPSASEIRTKQTQLSEARNPMSNPYISFAPESLGTARLSALAQLISILRF